jgi:hypothetical protein
VAVLAASVVVGAVYYNVGSSAALSDRCSATPPDASVARLEASSITVGWSNWPVGFDCIFADANGQVLAREYVGFLP